VAIVVPPMAAFAGIIVGNPAATTFAVFGAFALLGMADFGGPTIPRARAYAGATVVGAGLVLLGTLASGSDWSAVAGTVLVAFVVQLLGVFGGYVAAAQTALLLAFVVAVSLPAPAAAGWARVAGWTLAGGISLAAGVLLWPRHARTQVRQRASEACPRRWPRCWPIRPHHRPCGIGHARGSRRPGAPTLRHPYDQRDPPAGTEPWLTWSSSWAEPWSSRAVQPRRATRPGRFLKSVPCARRSGRSWRPAQAC
jgi:hypothetical protein